MFKGSPLPTSTIAAIRRLYLAGKSQTFISHKLSISRRSVYRHTRDIDRGIEHGILTSYQYGCRCTACKDYYRRYMSSYRERRRHEYMAETGKLAPVIDISTKSRIINTLHR